MSDGPIDAFLAELARRLRRDREARARALHEIGHHLRELAREGREQGLGELAAEDAAVERFGSARDLARGLRRPPRRSRRALAALAPALAIACGAVAFSELRSAHAPPPVVLLQGGRVAGAPLARASLASGCLIPVVVGRQGLIATRVLLDPRSGRVFACQPILGYGPPVALPSPAGPFGGQVISFDPRYATG